MADTDRDIVVETIGLTKVFKDFWGRAKVKAVDDLHLQIRRGEVFGLLGPNGSGKTTTIKMLLGLLYPTRGQARIFGKDPSDVAVKARIGYLPEETRLYQFLNSLETLDFYGRLFKLDGSERDRRCDALVDMVGLSPAASRPVGQYSKGMARRIGLAQALINDPDFLILDEPTAGMDPIGTRKIKDLILELKKRGKTVLLSSHLLADVEDVCDRVAIMYGGKFLCAGAVDDLLAHREVTEILTQRLTSDQVKDVSSYLQQHLGRDVVAVTTPRDRLEEFFLRQVARAQEQMTTSGALAGGEVSDFLRAEPGKAEGRQLLAELTEAAKPTVPEVPTTQEPAPHETITSSTGRKILDELLQGPSEPSPAGPTQRKAAVEEVRPRREEADRSVLDDLVKGQEPDRGKQADGGSER